MPADMPPQEYICLATEGASIIFGNAEVFDIHHGKGNDPSFMHLRLEKADYYVILEDGQEGMYIKDKPSISDLEGFLKGSCR